MNIEFPAYGRGAQGQSKYIIIANQMQKVTVGIAVAAFAISVYVLWKAVGM